MFYLNPNPTPQSSPPLFTQAHPKPDPAHTFLVKTCVDPGQTPPPRILLLPQNHHHCSLPHLPLQTKTTMVLLHLNPPSWPKTSQPSSFQPTHQLMLPHYSTLHLFLYTSVFNLNPLNPSNHVPYTSTIFQSSLIELKQPQATYSRIGAKKEFKRLGLLWLNQWLKIGGIWSVDMWKAEISI